MMSDQRTPEAASDGHSEPGSAAAEARLGGTIDLGKSGHFERGITRYEALTGSRYRDSLQKRAKRLKDTC
jgi:hypothetical protein